MNDHQLQAVKTRVPTVLVSAGAGSGKTRVLTQRYLDLLLADGVPMDRILTLTFTRKAAQEMRERIAGLLDANDLSARRRDLMRAPIGTIHGFCERVLRERALQAGIDPNFRVLDDAESRTLQEVALDSVFEEVWAGPQGERAAIGRLLLDYPHGELRASLLGISRTARTHGLSTTAIVPPPVAEIRRELDAAARRLCDAIDALLDLTGTKNWESAKDGVREKREELAELLPAVDRFSWDTYQTVADSQGALTPKGGPTGTAKVARDAVKLALERWLAAYADLAADDYRRAFLILLERLETAYRAAKDEQGLLDFEDLLLLTRELLVGTSCGDGARNYYRQQFRQVMVDEFQDTNPLQFSLIQAFQGDGQLFMVGDVKQAIYRFIGSDIRVFLRQEAQVAAMGEAGQRITLAENYRTRPEVLAPLNALFARLWPDVDADGFRFEPLTAGQTFIPTAEPSIELACWDAAGSSVAALRGEEARWIARRILQLTGALGTALPVTAAGDTPEARDAHFGDVIILFRASTDIPRYEEALRRAGIPLYVVSGRGFYQTREVQDVLALLAVLENPWDDFSLAVALRSPFASLSDDALYWLSRDWAAWQPGEAYPTESRHDGNYGRLWEVVERVETLPALTAEAREALLSFRALVRELQAALPAGQPLDLIDAMLAKTGYAAGVLATDGGEQRFANLQKLREVASDFQSRGIFDLSDFRRYLMQLSELAPREASAPLDVEGSRVVRLMTIHAAKGLEAPIVFLADGGREPNAINSAFLLSPDGIACKVPLPDGGYTPTATYQDAVARTTEEERRESERLLYVALTRAREHLICSGFTRFPAREGWASYTDILAGLLEIDGAPDADALAPLTADGITAAVRVWAPASLAAVCALEPPPLPPTLWQEYASAIRAGDPLPVRTDAEAVARFTQVAARLQLPPDSRRRNALRLGVNRALCYDKCPRQYWFRYVLRRDGQTPRELLPPMAEDPTTRSDDPIAHMDGTEFGLLLHGVLQRATFDDDLLDAAPALLAAIAADRNQPRDAGAEARVLTCLRRLMALPLYARLCRADAVHRELRFLIREDGLYVTGIIDALVREGDRWWVLDYKTGHPSADHTRQVWLYALGVQHTLRMAPERVALVYLHPDRETIVRDEAVHPGMFDQARQFVLAAGDGIRAAAYPPCPGRHCAACPFAASCPDAVAAVSTR